MPTAIAAVNHSICTEVQSSWRLCLVYLHQDALSWKVGMTKWVTSAEHLVRAGLLSAELSTTTTTRCSNIVTDYFPKASIPSAQSCRKALPLFKHLWQLQRLQGKDVIGMAETALFSMDGQLPHDKAEGVVVFMQRHILLKWHMPLDTLSAIEGLQFACCMLLIWSVSKHGAFSWSSATACRSLERTFRQNLMNCLLENSKDINERAEFSLHNVKAEYMYTHIFLFCFTGIDSYQRSGVSTCLPSFEGQPVLRSITSHALVVFCI